MSMTPRQRVLALLNGQEYDRIPTDYWYTPEFDKRIKADLGCPDEDSLCRKLNIDAPVRLWATCIGQEHPDDPEADIWGIRYQQVDYGTGAYTEAVHAPLASVRSVEEVHASRWPSADDFDYGGFAKAVEEQDGYRPIMAGSYEPFLLYCKMRGMEQAYEDLLLEPEIAEAILGHLFEFHYEHNRRVYELGQGKIDLTYVAEDLGSQTGPLMSLELYRRFLMPNQKKMADLGKSFGAHVFYHTDGAAYQFLPDLVENVGIEVLNPIQWRCTGMERERLVRDFGDRISFHGAVDNQYTLAFGTVDEVIAEVRQNIEIFKDARWICAPCHNIQPVSPTANVVAMYETIHEFGRL